MMKETSASNREILSTRVFEAPPRRVFEAFSDPVSLARWWGPAGFTNEFEEFDFRPGGRWRIVMHGPDGRRYEVERRFTRITPAERIEMENPDPNHRFDMTILTTAEGSGTRVRWEMKFESADHAAEVRDAVAAANEENFDRLAAELERGG